MLLKAYNSTISLDISTSEEAQEVGKRKTKFLFCLCCYLCRARPRFYNAVRVFSVLMLAFCSLWASSPATVCLCLYFFCVRPHYRYALLCLFLHFRRNVQVSLKRPTVVNILLNTASNNAAGQSSTIVDYCRWFISFFACVFSPLISPFIFCALHHLCRSSRN